MNILYRLLYGRIRIMYISHEILDKYKKSFNEDIFSAEKVHEHIKKLTKLHVYNDPGIDERDEFLIVKTVFYMFLLRWLEGDKDNYQSTYQYAQFMDRDSTESFNNMLKRKKIILKKNFALKEALSKKSGISYRRLPYKDEKTNKSKYPINLLNHMHLSAFGIFELEKIFIQNKTLPNDKAIKAAYENLQTIFCDVYIDNSSKNTLDSMEYTLRCINLILFESTYRFMFFAKLAEYACNKKEDISLLPDGIKAYIMPYIDNTNSSRKNSYFIDDYEYLIDKSFSDSTNDKISNKIMLIRQYVSNIYNVYCHMISPSSCPSWNSKDFKYAVKFFEKNYNLENWIKSIDFYNKSIDTHEFYNVIRYIYSKSEMISLQNLDMLKRKYKEKS